MAVAEDGTVVGPQVPETPPLAGPPPLPKDPEDPVEGPDEEELDSIQRLFEDLSEAQAKASKSTKNTAALGKHLQQVLYPLLVRCVGLSADLRDTVKGIAEDVAPAEEYLAEENVEFILGYIDVVFAFVLRYGAWANEQAQAGNTDFKRELDALYRGGSALKQIIQGLAEEVGEVVVEEVDDE